MWILAPRPPEPEVVPRRTRNDLLDWTEPAAPTRQIVLQSTVIPEFVQPGSDQGYAREGTMGTFVYFTQILTDLAPPIEQVVRTDVGSTTPLAYAFVDDPEVGARAQGSDGDWRHRIGLGWTPVGTIHFSLPWLLGASLTVRLVQFGLGTYVGSLRYAIDLDRDVDANVTFERDKHHGGPAFVGGTAASRLNAEPDLAKRVAAVLREEFMSGTLRVRGDGCGMTLSQGEPGSKLDLWTYGHNDFFGTHATTDAGRVLDLARLIRELL